ncbi:MAG TPA: hypothetical protein VLM89_01460 [Phycisphaerae bacterium]|nr:hypothetical protein [Phycisphaerae bacterium]
MRLNKPSSPPDTSVLRPAPQYAPPGRTAPAGRLDPIDKRQVFKQMVVGSLESGFLRYSKRKALLDYAAKIGISEFDAMLLIAEAQFYSDNIESRQVDASLVADPPCVEAWSPGTRLLFAVAAAAILDIALICWLFV